MEVLVALAMSLVIIFFSNYILIQLARENAQFFNSSLSRVDLSITSLALKNQVNNSMRINPPEPLNDADDPTDTRTYGGIAPLDELLAPSICQIDSNFSAIRVTYIDRRKRPERLLRLWTEDMADVETSANELRITYSSDSDGENAFNLARPAEEIVLVDLDGLVRRRFTVKDVIDRIDTDKDPADDLVKIKPDLSTEKFTYKALHLTRPKTVTNKVVKPIPPAVESTFITKSFAYPSYTRVICARKTDKSIISIKESDGSSVVLYDGYSGGYDVSKFLITFGGTRRDAKLNHSKFLTTAQYYLDANKKKLGCINIADVDFHLERRLPTTDSRTNSLRKMNTILLKNFSGQRVAACEASKITELAIYDSAYDFDP